MLETDNRGHRLGFASTDGHWMLLFFHSDPLEGIKMGTPLKAGQPLGHGNLAGGSENFDVTLEWMPGGNSQEVRFDSPMLHLSGPVAADYAKHGLTPENLVISKQTRDSAPCQGFVRSDNNWTAVQ